MIHWECLPFKQLKTDQLYEILKLRSDVFVVEQRCVYPDIDDKDRLEGCHHLIGYDDQQLIAYLRLLPAGVSYPSISLGRVLIKPSCRNHGYGHTLLQKGLDLAQQLWPDQDIELGAQQYLVDFYRQYCFVSTSTVYLEDGIPHVDMKLSK